MNAGKLIAVVEDEIAIRDNYMAALRRQGYRVAGYASRRGALDAFDARLPGLVIIDINLSGEVEGGFELCREPRARSAQLPIIFLTARESELDAISGLRLGAAMPGYLRSGEKPATGSRLKSACRLRWPGSGSVWPWSTLDPAGSGSDSAAAPFRVTMERSWPGDGPGLLLYRPAGLATPATRFIQSGRRLVIVGPAGWILFDEGEIDPLSAAFDDIDPSLTEQIYRFILRRDDPAFTGFEQPPGRLGRGPLQPVLEGASVTAWFARSGGASAVVTAGAPIMRGDEQLGAVILEQGSDSILTLTNTALVRLLSLTFLAMLIVAAGLLSYATVLSFRVRRLSRAAETALGPKGEIRASLPGRRAGDEIGDLARSFSDLLNRLRDYTAYLTTLKAKLAHELRTPLAGITWGWACTSYRWSRASIAARFGARICPMAAARYSLSQFRWRKTRGSPGGTPMCR